MSALAILAGCQNNLNGNDTKSEVADVFFSVENGDYCWYVAPGETAEAELVIIRHNASDEAEYAVKVLSADEGISVPATVSFAKDQTTATLVVSGPALSDVPASLSFELQFTGENVNASANSVEGTLRCEGTFYYYKLMNAAACFLPDSNGGDIFNYMGDIRQTVWRLSSSDFLFKNFLGSDYDLKVVIDPSTGYVQRLVGGYDLLESVDEWSGTTYTFYNEGVADFEENYYYEEFLPKGDARSIYTLSLYCTGGYSAFVEASGTSSAQLYFTVPKVSFYIYDADYAKDFTWQYLNFFFYTDEQLANCGFDTFPEVDIQSYPESTIVDETTDGTIPVQVYLENEAIDLDTQYGTMTDSSTLYIPNFMLSDCSLELIFGTSSFDMIARDNTTNAVIADTRQASSDYYIDLIEYVYPWTVNQNWCMYGFSAYNDPSYRFWYPSSNLATFYGSYLIYDGDKGSWLAAQSGYIDIYW